MATSVSPTRTTPAPSMVPTRWRVRQATNHGLATDGSLSRSICARPERQELIQRLCPRVDPLRGRALPPSRRGSGVRSPDTHDIAGNLGDPIAVDVSSRTAQPAFGELNVPRASQLLASLVRGVARRHAQLR